MSRPDSKIADYFLRAAFLVAIVILGASVELLWQGSSDGRKHTGDDGRVKYVVIGGSMSQGLSPAIQRHLRRILSRDDVDVIEMSDRMMTAEEASIRASRVIDTLRPKAVLLMVGMNEGLFDLEWMKTARKLLYEEKSGDFSHFFFTRFDSVDRYTPFTFLNMHRTAISNCDCLESLESGLRGRLLHQNPQAMRDENGRPRFEMLLRVALIVSRLGNHGDASAEVPSEVLVENYREFLVNTFAKLQTWKKEIRESTYERFVEDDDLEQMVLKAWFWMAWPRSEENPTRYFAAHPADVLYLKEMPMALKREGAVDALLLEPELRSLMKEVSAEALRRNIKFGKKAAASARSESLDSLLSLRNRGIRVVLLNYPGVRLPIIEETASRYGFDEVGAKTSLGERIRREGRTMYFYDDIQGTGHLTELGDDVYAREVADDLVSMER